ncbi:MAG: RpiB/LacA/LacB family sugar-phosphate isomerase [Candidatus Omnitrophica bacterium]|nr:RpiB/LacA/LacB family sugar-phosphate isomerase [Candidatus Omnitrophota bacterium]
MMTKPFTILFLCTGNSCRSPMAQAILHRRAEEMNLTNLETISAGSFALEGNPASPEANIAVEKYGASLDGFRTQIFTDALAEKAHLILAMERAHLDFIEEHYPYAADKVRVLGQYLYPQGPVEIPDPVGGPQKYFDAIARQINQCLDRLLDEWDPTVERYYSPGKKVIAVGVDHRAFSIKSWLIETLEDMGARVIDCGTMSPESCDHPDFAFKACELVTWRRADRAILMCATGHGMLLSANKVRGIRCIMPLNEEHAILSRKHNNTNALAFGADFYSKEQIQSILPSWLNTEFLGGKYHRRIRKIADYENRRRSV